MKTERSSVKTGCNPLPDNKILDLSKVKAFADDNFNVAQMVEFFFDGKENIVGEGHSAGYMHFLLSPQYFQNLRASLIL